MSTTLRRGDNRIFRFPLTLVDGSTALPLSSLALLSAELKQGETTIDTYIFGTDAELRVGNTSNEIELEVTAAVTAALTKGTPLSAIFREHVADAEFDADSDLFKDSQAVVLADIV